MPTPRCNFIVRFYAWSLFRLLQIALPAYLCSIPSTAQQIQVTVSQNPNGSITLFSTGSPNDAHVLLAGANVNAINTPASTNIVSASGRATFTITPSTPRAFYRVMGPESATPLAAIAETSPANGEGNVSLTRETIIRFTQPLSATNVLTTNTVYATFGGRRILSRAELASDRRGLTLFYLEPLPDSARVRLTLNGSELAGLQGVSLDADGDGAPGGVGIVEFDTASTSAVAGTGVSGFVFASELVPGGTNSTNFINKPLRNAQITVDGAEQTLRTTTDHNGYFNLSPCPAGRFFVHVDGRTAEGSQWPSGAYYPFVGKAWTAQAGYTNHIGNVYLPLISADTLASVSPLTNTVITFPASVLSANPALRGVSLTVPPNSLLNEAGVRGGRVGIAPVPPDRLPEPLPPGLDFPLVITVQTDGPQNFDQPVPVCFPNLPDPQTGITLAPGAKTALWSFNHDTGRWEIQGPMTVNSDGTLACSDPGFGIRQPGWHGTQQGTQTGGNANGPTRNVFDLNQLLLGQDAGQILLGQEDLDGLPPGMIKKDNDDVRLENLDSRMREILPSIVEAYTFAIFGDRGFSPMISSGNDGTNHHTASAHYTDEAIDLSSWSTDRGRFMTVDEAKAVVMQLTGTLPTSAPTTADPGRLQANWYRDGDLERDYIILIEYPGIEGKQHIHIQIAPEKRKKGPVRLNKLSNANSPAPLRVKGGDYYLLIVSENGSRQRIRTTSTGAYSSIHPPSELGTFHLYDAFSGFVKHGSYFSGLTGQRFDFFNQNESTWQPYRDALECELEDEFSSCYVDEFTGAALWDKPRTADSDDDSLSEEVEFIVGTNSNSPDTDGDGISDGVEVNQGTDPLSNLPVRTGILTSSETPGNAVDISALNNLAIVADYSEGVVVFHVGGLNPVRIASVDTPGTAVRVASSGGLVAVADGAAGLAVLDVADPSRARILHQIDLGADTTCVTAAANTAYVGLSSGAVVAVDMISGALLERVSVGASSVEDLALGQETLYALTRTEIYPISLDVAGLQVKPSVHSPVFDAGGYNRRLFFAGEYLYALQNKGVNVFVLDDPSRPWLIVEADSAQFDWKQFAPTGSRYAVAAVGDGLGANDVEVYDLADPEDTQSFVTRFETPGDANSVSIYNGLAYVADGTFGLQVINYLAYDDGANAPSLALTNSFPMLTATNGIAEEGKIVRITAHVTDDVQVRNVEFYVDGLRQVIDGSFPFEYRFVTPLLTTVRTNFTLQAKASDTGGNTTWSDPIVVSLVEDFTPPTVVSFFPKENEQVPREAQLLVRFSEPINQATAIGDALRLTSAGPDGILGTEDDHSVVPIFDSYSVEDNVARFSFPTNSPLGRYSARVGPPATDLAGIEVNTPFTREFSLVARSGVSGWAVLTNGIPVSGAIISLRIGTNTSSVRTTANGSFFLPTTISGVTPASLTVFVHLSGSLYRGSMSGIGLAPGGTNNLGNIFLEKSRFGGLSVLSADNNHSLGIRNDQSVWAWGWNGGGQLGDGTFEDRLSPVLIAQNVKPWIHVDAGPGWSAAIRNDGTLWTWGADAAGRLGLGFLSDFDYQEVPTQVSLNSNWVAVSAADAHGIALMANGSLWSWGENLWGNLGVPFRPDERIPGQVGTQTDWIAVSAGGQFSHAIRVDGSLWGWGRNNHGQLGDGTKTNRYTPVKIAGSNWAAVASGAEHTLALRDDGTLWAWGNNGLGALGSNTGDRLTPTQVGSSSNWVSVAAGGAHSLGLRGDGTLWAWGSNSEGQLGDGTQFHRYTPTQIGTKTNWVSITAGDFHSLGIRSDGTLWGWGGNWIGLLGNGGTNDSLVPIQIGTNSNWKTR